MADFCENANKQKSNEKKKVVRLEAQIAKHKKAAAKTGATTWSRWLACRRHHYHRPLLRWLLNPPPSPNHRRHRGSRKLLFLKSVSRNSSVFARATAIAASLINLGSAVGSGKCDFQKISHYWRACAWNGILASP